MALPEHPLAFERPLYELEERIGEARGEARANAGSTE